MLRKLILLKLALVCLALVFWWSGDIGSANEDSILRETPPPAWQTGESPILPGVSYVVVDAASQAVVLAQAANERRPLASVTKLLAACEISQQKDFLTTNITLNESDIFETGRAGRLAAGEVYTSYELLFPLLLESSNDAAAALLRQYPDQLPIMNLALQPYTISLADYSGLSDQNQGSARGVAQATIDCLQTNRHLFDITRLKSRVGEYVIWSNNSPVLSVDYRGGKHGYTEAAGRTLAAVVAESTKPQGVSRELVYVILGSADLALDLERLRQAVATTARFE